MSEAENQATAILLPTSSVAIYSKDEATLEAAQAVKEDWRFARVDLDAVEGDIETAIAAYQDAQSPSLVIVQTDNIDESYTERLGELAQHCSEGTAAIVIGPKNDVYLYRQMIEMGISDYLVRPIKAEMLADVIAKTVIERIGVTGSRLIAFVGAKGGVGTSAIAQAMAWGVADTLGEKTILLDAGGGWSTSAVGVGFEPSTTLAEAAKAAKNQDEDSLARMLFEASDKLSILASGSDTMLEHTIEPEQFEQILDMVMIKYPVVLVDLSGAEPQLKNAILARANMIVMVSTPILACLRLARSLLQEMKEIRGDSDEGIEMIINMQGIAPSNEVPQGDLEKAMEFKPSATIPFDPKLFVGHESESKKLLSDKDGADLVHQKLLPVLKRVLSVNLEGIGNDNKESGMFSGLLSKLTNKS